MSLPSQNSTSLAVQEPPNDAPLQSTTSQIFEDCDRFRVLLVGRSGVGKSSLINAIFDVDDASVQHYAAGEASIDEEITSPQNPRFVLHDSQGYQPGDVKNFETLKRFVAERKKMPDKKDRIHAIWLCIATPFAGSRVLETGDEKIFDLDLGKVPVVVVFTKYDVLVAKHRQKLCQDKVDHAEIDEKCGELAREEFDKTCICPLQLKTRNRLVFHVPLSTKRGYEDSLLTLVKLTQDHMGGSTLDKHPKHSLPGFLSWRRAATPEPSSNNKVEFSDSVALVFGVAQRVDPNLKIHNSIIVGQKKYWSGIATGAHFFGRRLAGCLTVLRDDIVKIWNIRGLEGFLLGPEFKAEISKVVEELSDKNATTVNPIAQAGVVVGLVASVAHPAAPITVPIAAGVLLAAWAYNCYTKTPGTVRCLMAYIVGLIVIMQQVFDLPQNPNDDAPSHDSALEIVSKYHQSQKRRTIHTAIRTFVDDKNIWEYAKKDIVFERIVSLIKEHCPSSSENGEPLAAPPEVESA
ncbi:hypothetical protein JAAARDRAFT_197451 [Jaapia argillacea MUCL 33604]|uniref:G domain-containing protein n=1 Tax=Jaapia argillacea MUCL 33604 TaxID=933084 RepID=A0A067PSI1_9AGAM|nr:hypothetical protein JAAARDRAFT_197451 [Jaapia argillacea MUCL 33604]